MGVRMNKKVAENVIEFQRITDQPYIIQRTTEKNK